jgi:hypothetical protein
VLVNRIGPVHFDVRFVGLDVRFNPTRPRSSVFTLLQDSRNMLRLRWSSASLLVSACTYPDVPRYSWYFSFFSLLFAATKNFPSLIGIASGASMVMYGLSPLFLSFFATNIFTDPQSGLDLARYLTFLALVGGTVNLFGACVLTVPDTDAVLESVDAESEATISETTSLLSGPRKGDEEVHVIAVQEPDEVSLIDLMKDPYFWVLFVFMSITIGCVSVSRAYREDRADRSYIDRDGAVEHRDDNTFLTPCLFCSIGDPIRSI